MQKVWSCLTRGSKRLQNEQLRQQRELWHLNTSHHMAYGLGGRTIFGGGSGVAGRDGSSTVAIAVPVLAEPLGRPLGLITILAFGSSGGCRLSFPSKMALISAKL